MADVILREYVEQLRAQVQARQLSDAFALGQHILRYYPKHIETYVALAQASLEADDLAGATDLFRRVLSADPENVLALAGMALIHETQERSDEALWYLERAFEIQPANDELRRELLRVRELYYGASDERLALTPGALARIYARQGQYAPAVNEFRRLLRRESQRYDARVALAETLYRAGRVDEAAQLAQDIMQDAPYALKPNLILGTLWTDNSVAEGQVYLERAQALDPEYRVARDLIGARFADMPPPRLPVQDQTSVTARRETPAPRAPAKIEPVEATELLGASEDIEEKLRAIERAEQAAQAQSRAKERVEPPAAVVAASILAAEKISDARATEQSAVPVARESVDTTRAPEQTIVPAASEPADATLAAIAAAEQQHAAAEPPPVAPTPPPTETAAPRPRSKTDAIPTDAIAAAAAALATSIAVDKLKQPAPARRTHPALPKVRPVIAGAAEKLPAWLRLGATPAQAAASFDAPPPTQAERIAPIVTPEIQAPPDNQPDWLVQAQEPLPGAPVVQADEDLPDWLSAAVIAQTENIAATQTPASETAAAQEASASAQAELPEWLRTPRAPEQISDSAPTVEIAAPNDDRAASAPNEPQADIPNAAAIITATSEPTAQESSAPTAPAEPAAEAASETVAPATADATGALGKLDARALIEVARFKRDNGDLKGALDSYERAMHRRPNYLDEIIGDLQALMEQPDLPLSAHRLLGEAYAMAGRFKESLEQYRLAMKK
ncbi:tetratricopeptide repeat protein [Anaerolineae bacterium CFX7]|nr:tetratricopeptide repeat protein [Anaerolineae bacterium CFX7]